MARKMTSKFDHIDTNIGNENHRNPVPAQQMTETSQKADNQEWDAVYRAALDDGAEGYAWFVAKAGQDNDSGAVSYARYTCESVNPGVSCSTVQRINLASVSKPITAVGVLKMIEDEALTWTSLSIL